MRKTDYATVFGTILLGALLAMLVGQIGFVTSALRNASSSSTYGESEEEGSLMASQRAALERSAVAPVFPDSQGRKKADPTLIPRGGEFHGSWSLHEGKVNGIPREIVNLAATESPEKVLKRYQRAWKRRGILALGESDKKSSLLQGVETRTGKTYRMTAERKGDGSFTEVSVTALGPVPNRVRASYPSRLPKVPGQEGLLITQSVESGFAMTDVSFGVNRPVDKVKFHLMRAMSDKGWKPYYDMPNPLPGMENLQFHHEGGWECSVALVEAGKKGKTAVQVTARWPEKG